jgi:phage terminase small subunit
MARMSRKKIREDIVDQLERKGVYGSHYLGLVNDYMALYEVKEMLIKDIKERGVVIEYQNGREQWGTKKNDSVSELNKTNAQMLKILSELGLRGSKVEMSDPDDEDM